MKYCIFAILTIFVCGIGIGHAQTDNDVARLKTLSKYEKMPFSATDQVEYLQQFKGDTITFDIITPKRIVFFVKTIPDTVWLTQKRKRNPKQGKDFELNPFYKGVKDEAGYYTPISEIDKKQFVVANTKIMGDDKYPAYNKYLIVQLIDLETQELLDCILPKSTNYELSISVLKVQKEIDALADKNYYIQTSEQYASNKTFKPIFLRSGTFAIRIKNSGVGALLQSKIELAFEEQDGTLVKYKPERFFGRGTVLSNDEYNSYIASIAPRYITSVVNRTLLESDIRLPFSFQHIIGTTNTYAEISQKIDPSKSYSSSSTYLMSDEAIGIGGRLDVKGQKYYKAFYNGKAFFINASNVKLTNEQKSRLDSLMRCSPQEQEVFFHKSLNLFKRIYADELSNALTTFQSYMKYGLNIETWGVYDESEYTDGTGIRFRFFNPTDQTIKYITINFVGYNAVDDPVSSRGKTVQTRKCVGPIGPEETATYKFEYVWFTDIVQYAKIRSIVVQYKNGSTKTITNAKQITFPEKLNEVLHRSNPVKDFH